MQPEHQKVIEQAMKEAHVLLATERPTFATQLGMELQHVACLKVVNFHGTAKGVRLVVTYTGDQHHEYEVLINPLYKEESK